MKTTNEIIIEHLEDVFQNIGSLGVEDIDFSEPCTDDERNTIVMIGILYVTGRHLELGNVIDGMVEMDDCYMNDAWEFEGKITIQDEDCNEIEELFITKKNGRYTVAA